MNSQPSKHHSSSSGDEGHNFHIVGVGASAGGLETLELFFERLPIDTGMGFVVVQHLSPDFKSHMEELLSRKTKMVIRSVEDGMEAEPNTIYLMPPRKEMVLRDGRLLLTEKERDGSLQHPIDLFFRSLATAAGRYAIGVVLSGTGSDGSRGIRDIHDAGGLVLAQDEQSCKFDGMPLNAAATGVCDVVLPPEGIADALVRYVQNGLTASALSQQEVDASMEEGVDRVFQLLHQQHGIDFSHYKSSTISRRIQRRIDLGNLENLDAYVETLNADSGEVNELYKDLLIGVTKFFRDPEAFEVLEKSVIPSFFTAPTSQEQIRVWVAGCATGEEAYTIAILLDEEARRRHRVVDIKVFATDAHHVSLNAAAKGVFPEQSLSELTQDRRERYFRRHRDGYHVIPELRRMIVFAPHNLINDAPFTQMNLVTCRNLLIYLQPPAQKKAMTMFHFSLRSGGTLFLGPSETPGEISDEFQAIDKRWRIYKKRRDVRLPLDARLPFMSSADGLMARKTPVPVARAPRVDQSLIEMYDRILDRKMPPSFLVDQENEILHIFGGAEKFLQSRGGRPSNNILVIAVDGLRTALTGALSHAMRKQEIVCYTGIQIETADGAEEIRLVVEPIGDLANGECNLLIEVQVMQKKEEPATPAIDVNISNVDRERISLLESELRHSQENLQATIEEMETSNEELQATNEELIASNEELQSTNEELHSVNEELYTVNTEHQRRVEELAQATDDMDNLLATTRVGVIFLDSELSIRRFTPEIGRLMHLLPHDIGRSFEGFAHYIVCENLPQELQRVLTTGREAELQIRDRSGTAFLLRIMPYRSGLQILGVVMMLIDIQSLKSAESQLARFKFMTEESVEPVILIAEDGAITYANDATTQVTLCSSDKLHTMNINELDPTLSRKRLRRLFAEAAVEPVKPFQCEWTRSDATNVPVEITLSRVVIDDHQFFVGHVRDITDRLAAEHEMMVRQLAIDSAMNGILMTDATKPDNPISYANPGFLKLTGYPAEEVIGRNCRFLQGAETDRNSIARLRDAIAKHESCRMTLLNYKKDGTKFWNDLQTTPVFDTLGNLLSFVGVQHDVTPQVESETASRQYAERIAAILNTTAEGIYGVDVDGNCTFCNTSAVRLLGYETAEELLGKHMHSLVHSKFPDGSPMPETECQIYLAVQRNEGVHVNSEVFWRKDDSSIAVEYRSEPLLDNGRLLGAVISFQDITERLRYVGELEQMGALVEASHDAILVWDLDGTICRWNTGAARMYGYSPIEALGKRSRSLLQTVHPGQWSDLRSSLLKNGEWVGTLEHRTSQGISLTVSSRHQLLTTKSGRILVLEINRDITEQQEIQKKLREANRAVKKASRAKSNFVANMSHELRTPMTAVLGFSEMLRSYSSAPEYLEKVDTIRRNGEYLLALLNDILDLSKIEAGKMDVRQEQVNVALLIEDLRSLMSVRALESGIPLHFEYLSEIPAVVTADRMRVRQILVNLIGNAIKFTDRGEVCVSVDFGDSPLEHPTLRIRVRDTGIGMTSGQLKTLFRPFTQATTETARKFGGTGLGLSISKRLAQQMNGTITVQSEYQKGSTFTLCLPVRDAEIQTLQKPVLGHAESSFGDDQESIPTHINARILLADDRRDVWRVACYFLEKCRASVEIAEDGRQAVDAVDRATKQDRPFDLILMDMQMPVMTGQEAVAELRRRGCKLPIIALTANAMEGERAACIAFGCDDYAPKPIDGPDLIRLVVEHLERSRHQT